MTIDARVNKLESFSEEKDEIRALTQLFLDIRQEQPEVFENLREFFDQND